MNDQTPHKAEIDAIPATVRAVVNALYPNETLDDIPPRGGMADLRVQTARRAIDAYLAAPSDGPYRPGLSGDVS